jgi:hypothetical protein
MSKTDLDDENDAFMLSSRLLRMRQADARSREELGFGDVYAAVPTSQGSPRFLGEVIRAGGGGSNCVHLVRPVRLDGPEAEGFVPGISADAARVVPVVVIGDRVPAVGELLMAVAVAGRWIAEAGGSHETLAVACSPCAIPSKNLVVSWTNPILGNGSTMLSFNGLNQWISACVRQIRVLLKCSESTAQLMVEYYVSGDCPNGQGVLCDNRGANPNNLILTASSCTPFSISFSLTNATCPILWGNGYRGFTITE